MTPAEPKVRVSGDRPADSGPLAVARRVLSTEAAALTSLAAALDHHLVDAVGRLSQISGRIIVSGIGKSGHIARKIAATFASTDRRRNSFIRRKQVMAISA